MRRRGTQCKRVMAAALLAVAVLVHPYPAHAEAVAWLVGVEDWDGDGHQDLIARRASEPEVQVYPGIGTRGWSYKLPATVAWGWPWNMIVSAVGDWDGDGHQDLVVRYGDEFYLYPGDGKTAMTPPVKINDGGVGYSLRALADWDRDGFQDLIVQNVKSWDVYMIPGNGKRAHSAPGWVLIGTGLQDHNLQDVADWDHDGHQDLLLWQDGTEILWLYPGESVRGLSGQKPAKLGDGWNWRYGRWPCKVADWDGDGHQDLIAADVQTRDVEYPDVWLYPGESRRGPSTQEAVRIFSGVTC